MTYLTGRGVYVHIGTPLPSRYAIDVCMYSGYLTAECQVFRGAQPRGGCGRGGGGVSELLPGSGCERRVRVLDHVDAQVEGERAARLNAMQACA